MSQKFFVSHSRRFLLFIKVMYPSMQLLLLVLAAMPCLIIVCNNTSGALREKDSTSRKLLSFVDIHWNWILIFHTLLCVLVLHNNTVGISFAFVICYILLPIKALFQQLEWSLLFWWYEFLLWSASLQTASKSFYC